MSPQINHSSRGGHVRCPRHANLASQARGKLNYEAAQGPDERIAAVAYQWWMAASGCSITYISAVVAMRAVSPKMKFFLENA